MSFILPSTTKVGYIVICGKDFFSSNIIYKLNNSIFRRTEFIRDRPYNLKGGGYGFLFCSEIFFRTTQELEYLFFLSRKARIFFPDSNIRLYDKNSESDYYFFLPPKSEYFFRQHWESEYFFRKKP